MDMEKNFYGYGGGKEMVEKPAGRTLMGGGKPLIGVLDKTKSAESFGDQLEQAYAQIQAEAGLKAADAKMPGEGMTATMYATEPVKAVLELDDEMRQKFEAVQGAWQKLRDDPPAESAPNRGAALFKDAARTINGERQSMYGNPENSFDLIAQRWQQYLYCRFGFCGVLRAHDVAFLMADFKMARQCVQDKRDNLVDAGGYLGILDDLLQAEVDDDE
jgi:hypothetical protein